MGHRLLSKEIQWRALLPFVRWAIFSKWGNNLCENNDSLPGPGWSHCIYVYQCLAHLLWWFLCETRVEENAVGRLLAVSTFLMMAVCKWRESVTFTNKQSPPSHSLVIGQVNISLASFASVCVIWRSKGRCQLKTCLYKLYKRFSTLCEDNIIYCGGHLHDWKKDVLFERHLKKGIQAVSNWYGADVN